MKNRKRKKSNSYKIFLITYIIAGLIFSAIFLFNLRKTLIEFENSQIHNAKEGIFQMISDDILNAKYKFNYEFTNSNINKYEKKELNLLDGLKKIYQTDKIEYKEEENFNEDAPIYNVLRNNNHFGKVIVERINIKNKYGFLTYSDWSVKNYRVNNENGFYYYDIYMPDKYDLYINDNKVNKEEAVELSKYTDALRILSQYTKIPKSLVYSEKDFIEEPIVKILSTDNTEVKYEKKEHSIKTDSDIIYVNTPQEAQEHLYPGINPLETAEKWCLFLTNDLPGGRSASTAFLNNYLMPNSTLKENAKSWLNGIENSWVGNHTLEKPPLKNEEIKNFEIFSKEAYSCEVKMTKVLKFNSASKKVDTLHERMYFCYDKKDKKWYLVSMQAITD